MSSKGLVFCGNQMNDPFCVTKMIETILSGVLLLLIIADGISEIRYKGRFVFGFPQVLQTLMLLTLICNITYAMDHIYDWFYYLESLFYDWYFCTLVFYVTYRVLTKSQNTSTRRLNIFKALFVLIMVAFLGIFIYSGLIQIKQCKCTFLLDTELWFLVIDMFGLVLCVGMICIGYENHREQVRKVLDFKNDGQVNNPLSRMWILILINVFCQVLQFTESLVFFIQTSNKCHFSQIRLVDVIVKFLFSIFSLHLSFACTILILFLRRRKQQKYLKTIEYSYTFDNRLNMLEMVPTSPLQASSRESRKQSQI